MMDHQHTEGGQDLDFVTGKPLNIIRYADKQQWLAFWENIYLLREMEELNVFLINEFLSWAILSILFESINQNTQINQNTHIKSDYFKLNQTVINRIWIIASIAYAGGYRPLWAWYDQIIAPSYWSSQSFNQKN